MLVTVMCSTFDGLRTVTVNGTSLAYHEHGKGEPVVFVHGSSSDLRTWDRQMLVFSAKYRAIAYSRRYARPNEDIAPGTDDQMHPHVEDLAAFLRSVDAPAAHLVGHSWGGFVALLTAIRYPDLVRSLVLVEPPVLSLFVSTPPRAPELLRLLARRPATAAAIIKFGATVAAPAQKACRCGDPEAAMETFGRGVLGASRFEQLSQARLRQVRENGNADRAQLMGAGFPPLHDDEVRGVRVPTLLVAGAWSPALFHRLTDRLQELLASPERVEIADASHLVHEDNPAAFNGAVLDFLDRQTAPRSQRSQAART